MTRRDATLLAVVMAAAAAMRLVNLDRELSALEINTWWYGRLPLADIFRVSEYFPLIYALIRLSAPMLGDSETALRLPFVALGILQVPASFLLARRLFDTRTGLWAALLTTLSPFLLRHAQTARYYAPFMLFSTLMLYAVLEARARRGRDALLAWAGYAAAAALALHTHAFALYPLVLSALSALWLWRERPTRLATPLLASLALALIASADTWPRYHSLLSTQLASGRSLLQSAELRLFNPGNPFLQLVTELGGGMAAGALGVLLAAAALLLRWRREREALALPLLWTALPLASLVLLRSYHHFEPWYFAFLAPLWLVWAGAGAAAAQRRLGRGGSAALAAAIVITNAAALARYHTAPHAGWREGLTAVNARCTTGDAVFLHPRTSGGSVARYYALREDCRLYDISHLLAPTARTRDLFERHARVWLVSHATRSPEELREAGEIRSLLGRFYEADGNSVYGSVVVSSFSRRGSLPPIAIRDNAAAPRAWGKNLNDHERFYLGNLGDAPELAWPVPRAGGATLKTLALTHDRAVLPPKHPSYAFVLSGAVTAPDGLRRSEGDIFAWGGERRFPLTAANARGAQLLLFSLLDEPPFLVRHKPGERADANHGRRRIVCVVLQGQLELRLPWWAPRSNGKRQFATGDAFMARRRRYPRTIVNTGFDDLILLIAPVRARPPSPKQPHEALTR